MINPYEPAETAESTAKPHRWWLWFLCLNLFLIAVPAILVGIGFALAWFVRFRESIQSGGDPVTYQHHYWMTTSMSYGSLLSYLMIPNVILFAIMLYVKRRADSAPQVER